MQDPAALAEHLLAVKAQGFTAFKIGWGPFGRTNAALDEAIVGARARRLAAKAADGGCRRQRCLLAARL